VSYSATTPEREVQSARRQNALSLLFFVLTVAAFVLRFCVSPQMMNALVDYTSEGGALYEKLHFGTYAICLLLPLVLLTRPVFLRGDEIVKFRDLVRFCGMMVLLIVFMIFTGRASSSGIFVDTYLVAGVAGLVVLAQNPGMRRLIGDVVLAISLVSALMGLFEAATRTRILPYAANEEVFRPIGLTDHPLTLGLMCAASIGFVALTRWPVWAKVLAALLLFVGTAAAGARFALLLAGAEVVALLVLVPWGLSPAAERKAKVAALLLTLVVGAGLIAVLAAGGFLSRFSDGVVDENFYARTDIYKIFDYVTWKDILFGADLDAILKIVNEKLKLPFIESTPVYLTFQLGAILAVIFAAVVFWLFWRLLRHQPRPAWIGTAVFLAAALSNNTLSSKTPVVAIFVVLLVCYFEAVPARRNPA
jgi:hypothetical protein